MIMSSNEIGIKKIKKKNSAITLFNIHCLQKHFSLVDPKVTHLHWLVCIRIFYFFQIENYAIHIFLDF